MKSGTNERRQHTNNFEMKLCTKVNYMIRFMINMYCMLFITHTIYIHLTAFSPGQSE